TFLDARPRAPAPAPAPRGPAVPASAFYYDGPGPGNPLVVVQVAIDTTLSPVSFDLGATTSTATNSGSGFDLAGLYSVDQNGNPNVLTGTHNVVVGGNVLLNAVPAGAITFFGLPANTTGGGQPPQARHPGAPPGPP